MGYATGCDNPIRIPQESSLACFTCGAKVLDQQHQAVAEPFDEVSATLLRKARVRSNGRIFDTFSKCHQFFRAFQAVDRGVIRLNY